jgi:hypothetical protein
VEEEEEDKSEGGGAPELQAADWFWRGFFSNFAGKIAVTDR